MIFSGTTIILSSFFLFTVDRLAFANEKTLEIEGQIFCFEILPPKVKRIEVLYKNRTTYADADIIEYGNGLFVDRFTITEEELENGQPAIFSVIPDDFHPKLMPWYKMRLPIQLYHRNKLFADELLAETETDRFGKFKIVGKYQSGTYLNWYQMDPYLYLSHTCTNGLPAIYQGCLITQRISLPTPEMYSTFESHYVTIVLGTPSFIDNGFKIHCNTPVVDGGR